MASIWHENGQTLPLPYDELRQVSLGMLKARQAMRGTLPASLIHDVALESLLALYIAPDQSVAIEHVVAEIDAPATLTHRWLAALRSEGLINLDESRASLSSLGIQKMEHMLTAVVQSQRAILGWADH